MKTTSEKAIRDEVEWYFTHGLNAREICDQLRVSMIWTCHAIASLGAAALGNHLRARRVPWQYRDACFVNNNDHCDYGGVWGA